ncbi:hypothetical protein C0Q70_17555 [Pomacea canaliculata]|uniref:Abasic site processing protein HMCES n=1 Tax=Pomacea canaliculata TaxID=400727 RepID=A0A2T7NKQ4_POMCA|nr:hypothetical protein C0Q70_17555 [Pomacea canaliculata]
MYSMYGHDGTTLNQDDVVKACRFRRRQGDRQQPVWRDAPGGQKYYPSYNVAPGAHTPVLLSSHHYSGEFEGICERIVQPMKWGLVPSWHKGDPYKLAYETNNCRADGINSSSCPLATNHLVKKEESLSTKNASSMHLETDLLAKGNPAIDANRDGDNAEWQGKRLLTMAGVFEICNSPAILTSDEEIDDWLNSAEVPLNKAVKVIRSVECLQMHMVSSEVNNSRNNSSKCMEPYEPKPEKRSGSSVFMKNWLNKGHSEAKKPKQN